MAKSYELLADELHLPTNKPGEPFTFQTYRKGDQVSFEADRAAELIEAGALKDPENDVTDEDGELAQSTAPGEKPARGQVAQGSGATPASEGEKPAGKGVQTPKA